MTTASEGFSRWRPLKVGLDASTSTRARANHVLALLAHGPRTDVGRLILALACVLVATLLRSALGLISPDILPYGLYLPAIVLASLLGGWRAGLAATAMAAGLSWFLFISPRLDFPRRREELTINFALMLAVSAAVVAMASRLRHARGRLEAGQRVLVERNRRYDAIFGSMSEGFALCEAIRDGDGRLIDYEVIEINPALQRMLGVGPEAIGTKLSESGGDWPDWLALCDRVLRRGVAERFEYEEPVTGHCHEVHVSRVSDGRMAQFFFDISERKTAERRQSELFSELNHRVKNNLSLISGLLQMQGRGETPEVRGKLEKAIDRIGAIAQVHDALSKNGRREEVDFGAYLKHLCHGLERSLIVDDRIALQVEADSAEVPVDTAIALGMVVNELVTNALKYAYPPPAEGAVTVRFKRTGEAIVLAVGDSGRGLPPEMPPETSSLGMKLVNSLVSQVKGRLEVIHHPGVTFEIRLPAN
ncbi:MAG: histidine kinase dimerization/phosphoacceptor domain -containing protein [Caulobacteraceae bacterium]